MWWVVCVCICCCCLWLVLDVSLLLVFTWLWGIGLWCLRWFEFGVGNKLRCASGFRFCVAWCRAPVLGG